MKNSDIGKNIRRARERKRLSQEKVAFELEPSTTAKPKYQEVKTGFGYHIIMVEGRK